MKLNATSEYLASSYVDVTIFPYILRYFYVSPRYDEKSIIRK